MENLSNYHLSKINIFTHYDSEFNEFYFSIIFEIFKIIIGKLFNLNLDFWLIKFSLYVHDTFILFKVILISSKKSINREHHFIFFLESS